MPRNTNAHEDDDYDWSDIKNLKNFRGNVDEIEEILDEDDSVVRKKKKKPGKFDGLDD